ncbi:MAG TPA: undecaprenyl-diphosphatase UppP [Anaerolineae bacterium]|nr:undecaprenyl-diphosphatase UppP [Anaerolineae bacterium]
MTLIQAILLGIIQGITEFLPISSSAHLVIVPYLFNWQFPQEQIFPFNVLIQTGTLAAVIIYFHNDLQDIFTAILEGIKNRKPFEEPASRTGWLVLIATIPAGLIGLSFKKLIEDLFSNPPAVAFFLFGTAFLLILAEVIGKRHREFENLNWKDSLWIGCFQALSVFPGISRSGACIAGGMTRNMERKASGQFTFLMAIPIMLAAGILSIVDLLAIPNLVEFLPILLAGFTTAAIVGYFAIGWLLNFIHQRPLFIFAGYCALLGALTISFTLTLSKNTITDQPVVVKEGPIKITYISELKWISSNIQNCANQSNNKDIWIIENPISDLNVNDYDAIITLNAERIQTNFSFMLGWEELTLAAHQNNPLQEITKEQAVDLLRGEMDTWGDLYQYCRSCLIQGDTSKLDTKKPSIWIYPSDNILQQEIQKIFFSNGLGNPDAKIAPTPEKMLQALSINPSAIGILPVHWSSEDTKFITVPDIEETALQLPIVASTMNVPIGTLKNLLICIQESISP